MAARIKPSLAPVMPQLSSATLQLLGGVKLCRKAERVWALAQRYLGSNPVLLLTCCMTLGQFFNLAELQFSQMRGFEMMYFFYIEKIHFPCIAYMFLYSSVSSI